MEKKVIFLDADGTLVDYQGKLPDSAAQAVRQARAAGHRVYLCTGRSRAEVYPFLWDIGLDGMIGGNGSYVEDHGTVIMHRTLSSAQCCAVVDWLQDRDLPFYLESSSGLFASADFESGAAEAIRLYSRQKNGEAGVLTVRQAFPNMIYNANLHRDDVSKISFVLHSQQDYWEAAAAFPELNAGTWGGSGEIALFGDLSLPGISKANAIDTLLSYLQMDRRNTIAFGDAKVDIPMLEHCACGVAMGNGGKEIRTIADFVTDDVDCDGLWNAFSRLHLFDS